MYGTEGDVGRALEAFLAEGGAKREDVFVASKAWDCLKAGNVTAGVEASLRALRVDYLDLYLLHAPFLLDDGRGLSDRQIAAKVMAAWGELEALVDAGKSQAHAEASALSLSLTLTPKARSAPSASATSERRTWRCSAAARASRPR
mmetsp:Transcript_16660/g.51175  ORF Transcript_16660/g.51175 Transcript_16660/m.51175 type:complete len:146 (-) Transcript_16660:206-643(-)